MFGLSSQANRGGSDLNLENEIIQPGNGQSLLIELLEPIG